MATPTRQQLQMNIEAMEKQGAPQGDIQGYLDTFKGQGSTSPTSEVSQATPEPTPTTPKSLKGFLGNTLTSGADLIGNTVGALAHPIKTVKALGSVALGGVSKLIPGRQKSEDSFDAVTGFYKDRYGSLGALKETAYNDPVGLAADVSTLFTGGGALASRVGRLGKVGELGELSALSKAGNTIKSVGQAIDPLSAAVKTIGKGTEFATDGRKFAPFASKIDQDVVGAANRQGVELPASALSKSKVVPLLEQTAGKSFFGGKIAEKVEQTGTRLNQIADDVIKATGESPDLSVVGKKISDGLSSYETEFRKVKNTLYDEAILPKTEPSLSMDGPKRVPAIVVDTKKSLGVIDEMIKEEKLALKGTGQKISPTLMDLQGKRSALSQKNLTAKELQTKLKKWNEDVIFGDKTLTGDPAKLKRMNAIIDEDMSAAIREQRPDLADALDRADAFFKEGIEKLNSSYGLKIKQFADQPDKILPAILNKSTSVEDIPRIYEVIGKDNIKAVQANFLEDMFKKARGNSENFTPNGLTNQINSIGETKLKAILSPEQFNAVKDLETLSKALGKGAKIAEGSQSAFLVKTMTQLSTAFVNPLLAAKFFLGDVLFGKFISSPVGQKFLTEGFTFTGDAGRSVQKAAPLIGNAARPLYQSGRITDAVTGQ